MYIYVLTSLLTLSAIIIVEESCRLSETAVLYASVKGHFDIDELVEIASMYQCYHGYCRTHSASVCT